MSESSKIEWTDATWNPIRARLKEPLARKDPADKRLTILTNAWGYHCEHASPGCQHCYAESMNRRTLPAWGTGLAYNVPNREKVEIFLDEEELLKPLKWKRPRKIFPCSMTDWCGDFVPDEMRARMLGVCALTPRHTYQFLTKRALSQYEYFASNENQVAAWMAEDEIMLRLHNVGTMGTPWPLPNVWLGVSCENQEWADKRIPWLLRTPAAVRFVSAEPLLGAIDFSLIPISGRGEEYDPIIQANALQRASVFAPHLHWVIVGGESGPGARQLSVQWIRSIVSQCKAAHVPVFVKQLGANVSCEYSEFPNWDPDVNGYPIRDRKGGNMAEWAGDLRVRQMPEVSR